MTEIMAQHSQLNAPSSRQDIVSALLNDYGNSFGNGDASPSAYSPVPALKELPTLPPRSNSIMRKPLPAVQRMNMKFQLRDNQDAPLSPISSPENFPPRRRKRIVSRSLSRDAKPPSLALIISNGSTATVPPTPAFPVRSGSIPSGSVNEKELPPPPPPAKSERRASFKQEDMGNKLSKAEKELARNDSLLSQDGKKEDAAAPPAVKRKALADQGLKKFKSLAELGNGPRGRKGAPGLTISAPRKASVDGQTSITEPAKVQPEEPLLMQAQLPPTPDEEKDASVPTRPKQAYKGLPSNPRANGPASPMHMRGKSSTGFNVLKAMRPAPPIPTTKMNPITPEMTPSPTLKPDLARKDLSDISPVSPLPPPTEQHRPFSYETHAEPQHKPVDQAERPATAKPAPQVPTPPAETQNRIHATAIDPPEPSPSYRPMSAPSRPTSQDLANLSPSPPLSPTESLVINGQMSPPSPAPFIALTERPIPLPIFLIPRITPTQLNCYTAHGHAIESRNHFQPMGCMVCHDNADDRRWFCTFCQLRICRGCSDELNMIPGRSLGKLLEVRRDMVEKEDNPRIVVDGGEVRKVGEKHVVDGYENPFRG